MAQSFRLGPYVLDRSGYRVLAGSRPLDLTRKLLDLLFYLTDRAGTLVTKEELLDALWPGANVTDNALAQAISELRDALGDDPASPQFIKTISRRGYRLIASVQPVAAGVDPGHQTAIRTIGVMEFANVTGDQEFAWLSNGVAETVTSDLRRLDRFRVVDRRRVIEASAEAGGSMQRVAELIGAELIVLGSYQRNGPQIRITARLVNVVSGEAMADAKVDGALEKIFELQDQVVGQLAADLGITWGGPGAPTVGRDTASLEAYRAFTEGWLRLESLDLREMPKAVSDLARAVAADPRYALAYAGLASGKLAQYQSTRADNRPQSRLLDEAIEDARRAVYLEPSLGEAHATLALVLVSAGQMEEAGAAARHAVELEPANWRHWFRLGHASWGEPRLRAAARTLAIYPEFAFCHFQIAMVHVARGRLTDAETILRHGAAVQDRQIERGGRYPALGLHWLLGLVRLAQGDVQDAIAELDKEERLAEPHRLYGREYVVGSLVGRAAAHVRAGRFRDGLTALDRALALAPDHAPVLIARATALAASGSDAAAHASLANARDTLAILTETRPAEGALVRAYVLTSRGDLDGAAQQLQSLLDDAPPGFAGWLLPVDPLLRQLTESESFAPVAARLLTRAR